MSSGIEIAALLIFLFFIAETYSIDKTQLTYRINLAHLVRFRKINASKNPQFDAFETKFEYSSVAGIIHQFGCKS